MQQAIHAGEPASDILGEFLELLEDLDLRVKAVYLDCGFYTLYQKRSAIETAFRTMREARARTSLTDPAVWLLFVLVSFLVRNLWLIVRWGVLATPRRGGRALPVWFRFEVFREWPDHVLDDTLCWKWEAPTNGVGIPATYLKQRESPAVYGVNESEALVRTPEREAFWGRA